MYRKNKKQKKILLENMLGIHHNLGEKENIVICL